MKKRNLRLLALVCAVLLLTGSLFGCNSNRNNSGTSSTAAKSSAASNTTTGEAPALAATYPEFAEHREIDITWFEQGWTGPEANLDFVAPEIEARTNLKMNYEAMIVPSSDDYTQKLNLMVAAKEVPDVFLGGIDAYTRNIYELLGDSGSLWDLKDLIPDYKDLYDLVEPELNLYRTKSGSNYFIPTQTGRGYELLNEPPHGLFIRQDFLDKLGLNYPETPEDFYNYLKRATTELEVNGQPVKGLLFGENIGGFNHILEMYFPLLGRNETYSLPFDTEDNYTVRNFEYTNSPELMEGAKFANRLYREGLVDSEALTIKNAQFQEKGSSGQYAAMFSTWWDMNTFSDNAISEIPDLMWVAPTPIYQTKEIEKSRNRDWSNWVGCWSSLIISKSVDEATLRHLLATMDYLVSEDGQMLVQAGLEGKSYEWNADGKYQFTDEFIKNTNDLDWNKAAAYGVFYYAQLVNNTPAISELQEIPPALMRKDNYKGWENKKHERDAYKKDMKLTLDYYFLPGEVEQEKFPPIKDLKTELHAHVLTAASEAEVEAYVNEWGKTCESMGMNDIIAERNQIMDQLKQSIK